MWSTYQYVYLPPRASVDPSGRKGPHATVIDSTYRPSAEGKKEPLSLPVPSHRYSLIYLWTNRANYLQSRYTYSILIYVCTYIQKSPCSGALSIANYHNTGSVHHTYHSHTSGFSTLSGGLHNLVRYTHC